MSIYLQLTDTMKHVFNQNNKLLHQVTSLEKKIDILNQHHLLKYVSKRGEGICVTDAPEKLLSKSILTPSLTAGIFNAKYLNVLP